MNLFKKYKPTTFLILCSLVMIFSFIKFISCWGLPGGEVGMEQFVSMAAFVISAFVIAIDRISLVYFKPGLVSIVEAVILIGVLYYFFKIMI